MSEKTQMKRVYKKISGNLNSSGIDYENPGSPPVFEGLVKLKSKKVKQENSETKSKSDDRDCETPKPVKKEKKPVKKEIKKEVVDSPHKIYLKKTKGEKKHEKAEKVSFIKRWIS